MADRVDRETRHRIMVANRGKNTSPEVEVRRALFCKGFRYRLHDRRLPGKPDIVLPSSRLVVFVHGCYWHGHRCRRKPHSKSNRDFWRDKVDRNRKRDISVRNELLDNGWRILVVWECSIRRRSPSFALSDNLKHLVAWIRGQGRLAVLAEGGFEECL